MSERERLIKLLGCKYNCVDRNKCLEEQADYLLENDIIVPPAKVGDKVYQKGTMYSKCSVYDNTPTNSSCAGCCVECDSKSYE